MKSLVFLIVLIGAFSFFAYSVRRLIAFLKLGTNENCTDNIPKRIINTLIYVFAQKKLLRDSYAGPMHFLIFWGFCILTIGTTETIINGLIPSFSLSFLGPLYDLLKFMQDVFGVLVIVAISMALIRRYILKPPRVENSLDALLILSMIMGLMITMFAVNGIDFNLSGGNVAGSKLMIFSKLASKVFAPLATHHTIAPIAREIFWWFHIIILLLFLNYLPYSKHLHVLSSIPNVFLQPLKPKGALRPSDIPDNFEELDDKAMEEALARIGANKITQLTWKDLLDGYTCTECNRCTYSCPAFLTDKPLRPREIIHQIRLNTFANGEKYLKLNSLNGNQEEKQKIENELVSLIGEKSGGGTITTDELWSCTTCGSCVEECPVQIQHINKIVDMRRYLTMQESNFPQELNKTFQNWERNSNPWGVGYSKRGEWAEGLGIKKMAELSEEEKNNLDYLFYVGCAGSFDDRNKKVVQSFAKIMQKANIKFAILGEEEQCCGETARRLGNEFLGKTLMKMNAEILNNYKVKKIVTCCPHCFNTLKNEYPQFGWKFEVIHHSELIFKLIAENKISLNGNLEGSVAYHDSCYLGRHNNIYNEPRTILNKLKNGQLKEFEKNGDKSFCCGAGGGRMWLEEKLGKRVNQERIDQALKINLNTIAVACPYCMTMFSDGVKEKGVEEKIKIIDLAEIVS